jgi:hypothetical protein
MRDGRVLSIGLIVVALAAAASGCGAKPMSQAQLTAIETREVDANLAATYNAAASALFDAGYTIAMSDRSAGLITGQRGKDRSFDRAMWSPAIQDDRFAISIMMRPNATDTRTAVRVKTSKNGEPVVDRKAIDQVWTLMQRQVLMADPLSPAAPTTNRPSYSGASPGQGTGNPNLSAISGGSRLPPPRSAR